MKNIEPQIFRKRLIVEGRYTIGMDENAIKDFLKKLSERAGMTPLFEPIIFSPKGHPLHHGIAGFLGWVESGCAVYTWEKFSFFAIEIFTCKDFSTADVLKFIKEFFLAGEMEYEEV